MGGFRGVDNLDGEAWADGLEVLVEGIGKKSGKDGGDEETDRCVAIIDSGIAENHIQILK